jgi:hypothetical protein
VLIARLRLLFVVCGTPGIAPRKLPLGASGEQERLRKVTEQHLNLFNTALRVPHDPRAGIKVEPEEASAMGRLPTAAR